MKYVANPVIVTARVIKTVGDMDPSSNRMLSLEDDQVVTVSNAMLSRMVPDPGDYYVEQEDGYVYLNPKAVFERKYSPLTDVQPGADQQGKAA